MLLDGDNPHLPTPARQTAFALFALAGTSVYGPSGKIAVPDPEDLITATRHDPQAKREWLNPTFLDILKELRRRKGRQK